MINEIPKYLIDFITKNFNDYNLEEKNFNKSLLKTILKSANKELPNLKDNNLTHILIITKNQKIKGRLNYIFFIGKKKSLDLNLDLLELSSKNKIQKDYLHLQPFPKLSSEKIEVWINDLVFENTDLKNIYEEQIDKYEENIKKSTPYKKDGKFVLAVFELFSDENFNKGFNFYLKKNFNPKNYFLSQYPYVHYWFIDNTEDLQKIWYENKEILETTHNMTLKDILEISKIIKTTN